ncbi:hypothetical protein Bpfe_007410 [Biomphalaria pfeifferi]|uniref:Uncharacterized protein n=1 Tax=Biomphalaria pfeifferi TaxID=112525 RepID=A0AAD8FHD0_BIOPF|nr:hypothetical protein Bpfe_007410 [Biomphalaria pfeifferi]
METSRLLFRESAQFGARCTFRVPDLSVLYLNLSKKFDLRVRDSSLLALLALRRHLNLDVTSSHREMYSNTDNT